MVFPKIENMKIVDMCKWIDDNAYREDLTEKEKNLIYKYMYFIIYSISKAHNYLHYEIDYDNFALYFAEWLYFRLVNNPPDLPKVVSVKNYVDKVLYKRIIRWQQSDKDKVVFEDFNDEGVPTKAKTIDTTLYKHQIKEEIESASYVMLCEDVIKEIECLPNVIDNVVEHTPYRYDEQMKLRISNSLLLSFLSQLNGDNKIICWHMSDSLNNLIKVLLNRVKREFVDNINYLKKKTEITDNILSSIIKEDTRG